MPGHRDRSSGNRAAGPLRWLERLLLAAGAAALMWCAVISADSLIAQANARSALKMAMAVHAPLRAPTGNADAAPRAPASHGSAIAALSIPRVQLSAVVLHGSDAQTLRRGPGHLEDTADPGDTGNIVIAGHRDSFFRPLRNIRLGDDIFLDTRDGRFHYRVTSLRVVDPRDLSVLAPTGEEVLTLITCYPFWVLGDAPDRFVVRAGRVADDVPAALEARSLSTPDGIDAPSPGTVTVSKPIATRVMATDDESLVRRTVRRYLLAQRGQLITCAVDVSEDRATADCESTPPSSSEPGQPGRMFALERSNDAWAIRSIELK